MSHTCKALTIHCMDFRFTKSLFAYMQKINLLGDSDLVGWAGSAQPFLTDEGREFVLTQVRLSHKLHSITEVHIIAHVDCGAYGGSIKFENLTKEREAQVAEIEKAREVINKEFPHITVVGHLAEKKDDDDVEYIQVTTNVAV